MFIFEIYHVAFDVPCEISVCAVSATITCQGTLDMYERQDLDRDPLLYEVQIQQFSNLSNLSNLAINSLIIIISARVPPSSQDN